MVKKLSNNNKDINQNNIQVGDRIRLIHIHDVHADVGEGDTGTVLGLSTVPKGNQSNELDLIIDQFTKQAIPFANLAAHSHEEAFKLLFALSDAGDKDTVLDVACGLNMYYYS